MMKGAAPLAQDRLFLRRLAGALARGSSAEADDIAQDAWAARLSLPTAPRDERPWFRAVVANLVRKRGRAAARARVREADFCAGAFGVTASAEDLALQRELAHVLAEKVAALGEPYREVVRLCYEDGLAPSEVARRLGVPAGTVRWRLSRALSELRAQLAADGHVTRRAWWPALPFVSSRWQGGFAVKTATKLVIAFVLLMLEGSAWLARSPLSRESSDVAASLSATGASSAAGRALDAPKPAAPRRVHVPRFVDVGGEQTSVVSKTTRVAQPLHLSRGGTLKNRFEKTPHRFDDMQRVASDLLDAVKARAEVCLQKWVGEDQAVRDGVMLGIDIESHGLKDVWFDDRDVVPSGPLTCFSEAVYGLDWKPVADLAEQPATITVNLRPGGLQDGGAAI